MGCGSSNAQTALETNSASMPHKNGDVTKGDKADDKGNVEQTTVPAIEIRKCLFVSSLEGFSVYFEQKERFKKFKSVPGKHFVRFG